MIPIAYYIYIYKSMSDNQQFQREEQQRIQSMIVDQIAGKELYLNNQDIQNDMVQFLCSKKTDEIKLILIGWNYITAIGVTHFRKAKWTNLSNLSLWNNWIQSKGCKQLSKVSMQHLEFLNLNENYIEDEGIHHLSKLKVPSLVKINLEGNHLSSKSIQHLIKTDWKEMKGIHLHQNKIRVDGVPYFVITLNKLALVRLNNNRLHDTSTRNIVNHFTSRFKRIEVHI